MNTDTAATWPGTCLESPLRIGGEDCLLAPDEVGPSPRHDDAVELEPGIDDRPPIWIREAVLARLRHAHPRLKVYGLWQTLYASALVERGLPLQVVPTGERDGHFLVQGKDGAHSGVYRAGRFPESLHLRFEDARPIAFTPQDLKRPARHARLLHELRAERQGARRRLGLVQAMVVATVAAAALLVDQSLARRHQEALRQFNAAKAQLATLQAKRDALDKRRLAPWPNQGDVLAPIMLLAEMDPVLSLDESELAPGPRHARLSGKVATLPGWVSASRTQDGAWAVQWRSP